jgi:uncharacterized repeat protein (TIGR01451 family)
MRLIYLAILALLISSAYSAHADESDNGLSFSDFTLYIGDSIVVGNYTAQLIEIQSVRDGLVVMQVSNANTLLNDQRVFLLDNANNFDGGAGNGGLTVTVTDIFDDQTAKVRVEYLKDLGTPTKHVSEGGPKTGGSPDLTVRKSFDRTNVNVGDEVKVTVTVKNIGTDTASNIQVEDMPPIPEFSYVAGYPPKIKETLGPGESDYAVYVMDAVKEGSINVPAIEVTYTDPKKNSKSNTSQPFDVYIGPESRPNIEILVHPPGPMTEGDKGLLNVSVINTGNAPATGIQIQSDVAPADGLTLNGVDRIIPRIDPGGMENYSADLVSNSHGNYTISLRASYQYGDGMILSQCKADVVIREREYKYLYYLPIIPIIAIGVWIFRRYREYKY